MLSPCDPYPPTSCQQDTGGLEICQGCQAALQNSGKLLWALHQVPWHEDPLSCMQACAFALCQYGPGTACCVPRWRPTLSSVPSAASACPSGEPPWDAVGASSLLRKTSPLGSFHVPFLGLPQGDPKPCSLGWPPERQMRLMDLPGGPVVKNPPANAGEMGSVPGLGRSHIPRGN